MTADQQKIYFELEIKKLRMENARLRSRLGERSRHRQRVEQAKNDAMLLLLWKGSGVVSTSLSSAQRNANMSRRRWQNAVGLLRMARLVDHRWVWHLGNDADNGRALAVAAGRAAASRESFLLRLTKHGQQSGREWRERQT